MKKNKYIISYSIQLILTLAVLGAVIWYAQIMPINTPLVSAFNFDLAQFGIIIGLVMICLVYIFILVGFLVAAIRQKQVGNEHYLVSTVRIILPIVFIFIFQLPFTNSYPFQNSNDVNFSLDFIKETQGKFTKIIDKFQLEQASILFAREIVCGFIVLDDIKSVVICSGMHGCILSVNDLNSELLSAISLQVKVEKISALQN